jgi:hypothetical protein
MTVYNGNLSKSEIENLRSLIGKKLLAYGTAKPGVDSRFAVQEVFIEVEDQIISVIEEFELTDVCGEVGEYVKFEVLSGYQDREKANELGGAYFHFHDEIIRAINIYRAHLERFTDGVQSGKFEHDAGIELVLESGSLRFLKSDLSTPLIEFVDSETGREPSLPDPAAGWPKTLPDTWDGSWTRIPL